MNYLKLFQNHSEYEDFVSGGTMMKPNVSHCVNENEVHYNPVPPQETRVLVNYYQSGWEQMYAYLDNDGEIFEIRAVDVFDKVEIDGEEVSTSYLDSVEGKYFKDYDMHEVKYTLTDNTQIDNGMFAFCNGITSVVLPNTVTSIGRESFYQCYSLSSITIPNSVTSIERFAFGDCVNLSSITLPNSITYIGESAFEYALILSSFTIEATTPPSVGEWIFSQTSNDLVIYVPAESVNAYKAASGWSNYASRIQAIPTT